MDIEKIRKLSKNASEAGKLVKAVTAYKNELKDKEQMRDVIMGEHFKTLREPVIEQQKTDEKQDKVIEQLKENQLALTSGIQALTLPQKTGWLSWLSIGLPCGRSWVQTPAGPTLRVFK